MTNSKVKDLILKANELIFIGPCPYEENPELMELLSKKIPIIAVDKGLENCPTHSLIYSVGDGDSSSHQMDYKLPKEKNQSDLRAALGLLTNNITRASFYGFLGLRRDHEWINMGEIYSFVNKMNFVARIDRSCFVIPKGRSKLLAQGTFSVMSLYDNEVKLRGHCKYQLETTTKISPLSSHGLSNVGSGMIHLESSAPLIVYFEDEALKWPECGP